MRINSAHAKEAAAAAVDTRACMRNAQLHMYAPAASRALSWLISWLLMSMTDGSGWKVGWLWYQPTTCMPYRLLITSCTCEHGTVEARGHY